MSRILTKRERDSLPHIVAVDFDGTLVEHTYKGIGEPNLWLIEVLKGCQSIKRSKLILWTCRDNENEDRELDAAVEFCKRYGLTFDAVNDNIEEVKQLYQGNPRKIIADEYWDDKAWRCTFVNSETTSEHKRV